MKLRRKFDKKGQVIEEWHFNDKEMEVRSFGVTDGQGNSLPDEISVSPPFELPPRLYEYNELGDVIRITDTNSSQFVADSITLTYDSIGNWIERTAHGNSMFYYYESTEQIYTRHVPYRYEYVCRQIEYYKE